MNVHNDRPASIIPDSPRPGSVIRSKDVRKAYYYEDDGSLRRIYHAVIQEDGKVKITSQAVAARIDRLQAEYGSGQE